MDKGLIVLENTNGTMYNSIYKQIVNIKYIKEDPLIVLDFVVNQRTIYLINKGLGLISIHLLNKSKL